MTVLSHEVFHTTWCQFDSYVEEARKRRMNSFSGKILTCKQQVDIFWEYEEHNLKKNAYLLVVYLMLNQLTEVDKDAKQIAKQFMDSIKVIQSVFHFDLHLDCFKVQFEELLKPFFK